MFTKHRSPFESPSRQLVSRRKVVWCVRNVLIVGAVLVVLVEQVGEPLLRWEYRYRGQSSNPTIFSATYIGVRGRVESADLNAGDCPVVLFVQPNPPLWRQASDRVLSLLW